VQRSRQQIVEILKRKGKATLEELATQLGLAPITVRAHLSVLERDHLVTAEEVRGKVGRPFYVYSLTESANELFPRNYDALATRILDQLRLENGSAGVARLFHSVADKVADRYAAQVFGSDVQSRLAELAKLLAAEGTLAEWEQTGEGLFLRSYNCPYYRVARAHPEVCELDRHVFRKVLGTELVHVERMAEGDKRCSYLVRQP